MALRLQRLLGDQFETAAAWNFHEYDSHGLDVILARESFSAMRIA